MRGSFSLGRGMMSEHGMTKSFFKEGMEKMLNIGGA